MRVRFVRWQLGTVASRRASVALGLVLVGLAGVAIVGSRAVGTQSATADRTIALADLFQDARYYASVEDAELNTYRLTGERTALVAYEHATDALDQNLKSISVQRAAADDTGAVEHLLTLHTRYEVVADQVIVLLAAGEAAQAAAVQTAQVDPAIDELRIGLGVLEEAHHLQAVAQLRAAHGATRLLGIGTPVALGLALLLLGGLGFVGRAHRRALQAQALHDALTGLPNRLLFADRSAHALAAAGRSGAQPAVMMLDLDHFKEVNDTLGHHHGDLLLIQVAARLSATVRASDTVARLGGDEFAVLLTDGGTPAATDVAERIIASLEPSLSLDGVTVSIEASIGIAAAGHDATPGDSPIAGAEESPAHLLLRHADMAMYDAKAQRSGYAFFAGATDGGTPGHLALLGELRHALDHDELVLHYQPKVAADTGELLGVEALVRWSHPTRGLLMPADFIGLAESTTLIQRLTTVVIDKALAFTSSWLDEGRRLPVAVNVSARSLLNLSFPTAIAAQLHSAGVPPEVLCLEITESTIMTDPDKALAILRELHAMGVRLSVDDFGTGYSSMAYLKLLPVDELKVDRSFVAHMTTDHQDGVLVQSAINLGHNLGLSVVAEGVEDHATLTALKDLGADVIQGYYLGRPMPGAQLRQWAIEHAAAATR